MLPEARHPRICQTFFIRLPAHLWSIPLVFERPVRGNPTLGWIHQRRFARQKEFENMQALRKLPKPQIRGTLTMCVRKLHVHLENPTQALAFQIQLAARDMDGKPVIPLLWTDDFVELMVSVRSGPRL